MSEELSRTTLLPFDARPSSEHAAADRRAGGTLSDARRRPSYKTHEACSPPFIRSPVGLSRSSSGRLLESETVSGWLRVRAVGYWVRICSRRMSGVPAVLGEFT